MKLYFSPASPFVRKVMVLLHETDQLDAVEQVNVATTPVTPDAALAAANPLRKLPALARDEGVTLYDSRVITAFLDERAQAGLYSSGSRHWEIKTLEATADGIMDSAVSMTYEGRVRPEDKQWDGWLDAQWGKVVGGVAALNSRWMSHLSGPLDMGQIAVGCALGYLDLRHDAQGWRKGHDALAAWYETFAARPSMIATAPSAT